MKATWRLLAATTTHDYKRNGTIDLFAAMNVATGQVLTGLRKGHTGTDVPRFFKQIDATVPRDLDMRMVGSGAGAVTPWRSVSSPRPSNRVCGSPAHGSPTPFTGGVRFHPPGPVGLGATTIPLRLIRPRSSPELRRYARPGDTIVATNLDRIGRNLREMPEPGLRVARTRRGHQNLA